VSVRTAWTLAAVVALAIALRLPVLDADPPPDVQYHHLTDEGQYAHNARQHVRFGAWVMDEHNDALYTAPLHTALVDRASAWLGPGLAATRLPGALAGIVTCALIVLLLGGRVAPGVALCAGLLAAAGTFMVTHSRVAFTESLQLSGVTLAVLATWRAARHPAWGAAAALGILVAPRAKLSSAPVLAVIAIQWAWRIIDARRHGAGRQSLHAAAAFAATLAAGALAALPFAAPHLEAIRDTLGAMARLAVAGAHPVLERGLWYGFRDDPGGARSLGGLFAQEPALVLGTAWLAAAAWLGRRVPGDRFLVGSCWVWIGVLLAALATHPWLSPDRRYLLLVPPLGILLSLAAFARREEAGAQAMEPGRWRFVAAWLTLALGLAIYLRPLLIEAFDRVGPRLAIGAEAGLSHRGALALGWMLAAGIAALLVAVPGPRSALRPAAWPARALVAWALAGGLLHAAVSLARPSFSIRDASRAIGEVVRRTPGWPHVALGSTAETLALENDLRCLVVRDWPFASIRTNLDSFARLDRAWVVAAFDGDHLVAWSEAFRPDTLPIAGRWPIRPGPRGAPRLEIRLLARDTEGSATSGHVAP